MFALTLGRSGKNVFSLLRQRSCLCWHCYTFMLPIYLFLFCSCFKTRLKNLLVFSIPSSSSSGSFLHFVRVFTSSPEKKVTNKLSRRNEFPPYSKEREHANIMWVQVKDMRTSDEGRKKEREKKHKVQ